MTEPAIDSAPVRVRFAPSPTGYLHVGGARTALFNWLLARRRGGAFVLRIEDTDVERSSDAMVTGILDGLRWLGLDWDEGPVATLEGGHAALATTAGGGPHAPYFQSARLDRYRALAARLVEEGHAYYCYCTPERLQRARDEAQARGASTQYDRACLRLSPEEIARLEATGAARAIRFRVPGRGPGGGPGAGGDAIDPGDTGGASDAAGSASDPADRGRPGVAAAGGRTRFVDLVHGEIAFDHANIEDFVILRSDQHPTYHLSVVADDVDMQIGLVLRGDDHISNTPKHVLLFEALGAPVPRFAHVPLILGTDKKRLSKRHGATSVMEYARLGYLPEALVNFLALLGWSPGDDREFFTRGELIEAFALEGISGGNAVFNPEKLDWMNGQHIMRLSAAEVAARLDGWLSEFVPPASDASDASDARAGTGASGVADVSSAAAAPGASTGERSGDAAPAAPASADVVSSSDAALWREAAGGERRDWLLQVIDLLKPRAKRLGDFVTQARPFLGEIASYDPAAVKKHWSGPDVPAQLAALAERLDAVDPFEPAALEQALRALADERGVKAGSLIHATRLALTGAGVSPGLFEVMALLGRDRVRARFAQAQAALQATRA